MSTIFFGGGGLTSVLSDLASLHKKISQIYTSRVARWYIFKPKIPIIGILLKTYFGTFYEHLAFCILWPFGIFYGQLVNNLGFGLMYQEKSGNPVHKSRSASKREDTF
jgi:hypothetical protein